jgi:MOSC domain-containing protein YiiM
MIETKILSILNGKIAPLFPGEKSAIVKTLIERRAQISFLGLAGDEQADRAFHGGPDKALHHYPADHYAHWARLAVNHPLLNAPGAFGENISTLGLTEDQVCIGDRFRCGSALIEISQGREPCWKQAARMEWSTLPKMMVRERRSGWYYRVIEEGNVQAGDSLTLVERPLPDWTVKRVFGLLIAGDHIHEPESLPLLRDLPVLFEGWRARAVDLMMMRGQYDVVADEAGELGSPFKS